MIRAFLAKHLLWLMALALVASNATTFWAAWRAGNAQCVASSVAATAKAQTAQDNKTVAKVQRSQATGRTQERTRAAIDKVFVQLEQEAADAPAHPVDGCVLPDERLRAWAAANAGPGDTGAPAAQPAAAPPSAAPAPLGPDAGPGGQPPRGGQGLPPGGQPAVPAAGLSGATP